MRDPEAKVWKLLRDENGDVILTDKQKRYAQSFTSPWEREKRERLERIKDINKIVEKPYVKRTVKTKEITLNEEQERQAREAIRMQRENTKLLHEHNKLVNKLIADLR